MMNQGNDGHGASNPAMQQLQMQHQQQQQLQQQQHQQHQQHSQQLPTQQQHQQHQQQTQAQHANTFGGQSTTQTASTSQAPDYKQQQQLWEDTQKWLKEVMRCLKLTHGQVAERSNLDPAKLDQWWNDQKNHDPQVTTALRQWVKKILERSNTHPSQPQQPPQQQQQQQQQHHHFPQGTQQNFKSPPARQQHQHSDQEVGSSAHAQPAFSDGQGGGTQLHGFGEQGGMPQYPAGFQYQQQQFRGGAFAQGQTGAHDMQQVQQQQQKAPQAPFTMQQRQAQQQQQQQQHLQQQQRTAMQMQIPVQSAQMKIPTQSQQPQQLARKPLEVQQQMQHSLIQFKVESGLPDDEPWAQSGPHKVVVVDADTPAGWIPEYADPFHLPDKKGEDGRPVPRDIRDFNIPIKLDISLDGRTLKDTLTWNAKKSEQTLTIEQFAKQLCEDTDLPGSFEAAIVMNMNTQINEALEFLNSEQQDIPNVFNEAAYGSKAERLHRIKIEARVNDVVVEDQIVWDLKNPKNNPDVYAAIFCRDMHLPADMVPIIAQSIRDQIKNARKMLKGQYGDAGVVKFARSIRGKRELERWGPTTRWLSVSEKEVLNRQLKKQQRGYDMKQRQAYGVPGAAARNMGAASIPMQSAQMQMMQQQQHMQQQIGTVAAPAALQAQQQAQPSVTPQSLPGYPMVGGMSGISTAQQQIPSSAAMIPQQGHAHGLVPQMGGYTLPQGVQIQQQQAQHQQLQQQQVGMGAPRPV